MVTWKLLGWLRMALVSILALAPLAQHRGPGAAPGATPELAIDVDGDGRADRVRLVRHDDGWWLDVALARAGAQPDELALRSTTRVAPASAGKGLSLRAADVNGDGKMDVLVRDAGGHTTAWISDGIAFATPAPAGDGGSGMTSMRTDERLDSYRREQS